MNYGIPNLILHTNMQQLIARYCDITRRLNERSAAFSAILDSFHRGDVSILTFVDMCPELNSESDSTRRQAIHLFNKLFSDPLLSFEAQVACIFFDFFYKRLDDYAVSEELLKAIVVIVERYPQAVTDSVLPCIQYLSKNIRVGTLKYSSRRIVYSLLLTLLSYPCLLDHAEEVGSALVNIIENEKDPRGVVQVCNLIHFTLTHFAAITPNTLNDLEMIGIGYFPVTYVTPPIVSGNIDVVTSEAVKTAVIEAITSIKRCTPLLLPFLETSLRDTSPNSKEQAAFALLRLVHKHGWSREMCDHATMTPEEEERWSELILTEFIDSAAKSKQEAALHEVIKVIAEGREKTWRDRWISKAKDFLEKNPVNMEMEHWAWILRCGALADMDFFDTYTLDLWKSINSSDNVDVQKSLLSVLLQLLLPHDLERIRKVPFLESVQPMIERVMSHFTIVSFRSISDEIVPFILGSILVNTALFVNLPENYIESFLCLPSGAHPDCFHVAKLACSSALFDPICHVLLRLIQQNESRISERCSELFLSTFIKNGVTLKNEEKSREVSEALLREVKLHPKEVDWMNVLDWMDGIVSYPEFYDLLFGILETIENEKRNEFLELAFHHFPNKLSFLQQLTPSNLISQIHGSFHSQEHAISLFLERCALLLFPLNRKEFIRHFIPSIFDIPSTVDEITQWCTSHPFFKEIESLESMTLFGELMKSNDYLSFHEKELIMQWSVLSIPVESTIPDHLLTFFASIMTDTSLDVKLPSTNMKDVIDKLVQNGNHVCMELALKILGSTTGGSFVELKLRCLLLALQQSFAVITALEQLDSFIQKNSKIVSDHLDSLLNCLLSFIHPPDVQQRETPVIRLLALRVLKRIADYPLTTVLPYAARVTREIGCELDNSQRAIREYAARVRNLWLMIHFPVC